MCTQLRTLFTIHGGEWLVGDYIERKYQRVNVWVPAKDTGVDLLVSDSKNKQVVSLQVKVSRDHHTDMNEVAKGWWKVKRKKIADSPADYWIFGIDRLERNPSDSDFVIIKPAELLRRLDAIHGKAEVFLISISLSLKNVSAWKRVLTRNSCSQSRLRIVTLAIFSAIGNPSKTSTGHDRR
jgi:hypothetical protein